jgi:serine/threonine-protein kinase HipA
MASPGPIEAFVQISGEDVAVGKLWMHRTKVGGSATFVYDSTYLRRSDSYELDPDMPLTSGQLQTPAGRPLFGALSDTAPDRWGRTLVNRTEVVTAREEGRAPRSIGERDYLLGVRDDMRQGALRYRVGEGKFLADETTGVPPLIELRALLNASEALASDTATSRQLRLLLRGGSSLGGARPKAHVVDRDGTPAIAKFPSPKTDDWDVNRWEVVALTLARNAGIRTADHQLHGIDGKPVVLLKRFDRQPDWTRIGYVSAMTLLSGADGHEFDYLDLATQVEVDGHAPTRDLQELWTRCAYGRLISNTDDHMRNHGFLRRASGWELSPAFDLNPNPYRAVYATAFAGDDEGNLLPLIENAELFRLTADQVAAKLAQIVAAVDDWRYVAASCDLPTSAIDLMDGAFEAPALQDARDHIGRFPAAQPTRRRQKPR